MTSRLARRTAGALVVLAIPLLAVGCGNQSNKSAAARTRSSPPGDTSTTASATTTAAVTSAVPDTSAIDDHYLTDLRQLGVAIPRTDADEAWAINLGHAICGALIGGISDDDVVAAMMEAGNGTTTVQAAAVIVGTAKPAYCPQVLTAPQS
jgi:hypothetical protein